MIELIMILLMITSRVRYNSSGLIKHNPITFIAVHWTITILSFTNALLCLATPYFAIEKEFFDYYIIIIVCSFLFLKDLIFCRICCNVNSIFHPLSKTIQSPHKHTNTHTYLPLQIHGEMLHLPSVLIYLFIYTV